MSHPAQMQFVSRVQQRFPHLFASKRVLEVGSLNINGSIRQFFSDCEYVGVDLGSGPGVDIVCAGEDLSYPDSSFDVVASCECFEHNPNWVQTFNNMARMSKELVFFSCATTGRSEHGTRRSNPQDAPYCGDYYANITEEDVKSRCELSVFKQYEFAVDEQAHDLYFWGVKK